MHKRASPRIVIVGAGVAGIAAATSLLDRGFDNVTIIEAEKSIGGRICSVPFGNKHVDVGAHWIHGELGNPVYELIHEMGLTVHSGDFNHLYFVSDDGRTLASDTAMNLFAQTNLILENQSSLKVNSGSLKKFLVPRCKELASQLIKDKVLMNAFVDWVEKFECTIEGCDQLNDVSAVGLTHYQQCDGDPILSWKEGGYANIIDILLRKHPKCVGLPIELGDRLVLNTEVIEIDWNGLTALVKCSNRQLYRADHVIITVSLGVLKERYKAMFNPALPLEKIRAILGLGIGTVDKIYLKFPYRWWPTNCSGFSLLRTKKNNEGLRWENEVIGFYTESVIDDTILCAWIVGDAARDMESFSDENVLSALYRVLQKFLEDKFDVPYPEAMIRSRWYSNPHFRGSYSFRSLSTEALETSADILAEPLKNFYNLQMLLFAGEATHNHFYSTVHGAMESGWREARRIAEMYSPEELKKCSL